MKRTYEILTHKGSIKNDEFQITPLSIRKFNGMKKLSVILLTTFLVMGIISCTDLKEEPYSTVTTASFFKNETDAEIAINGIYNGLHDIRFSWQESVRLVIAADELSPREVGIAGLSSRWTAPSSTPTTTSLTHWATPSTRSRVATTPCSWTKPSR